MAWNMKLNEEKLIFVAKPYFDTARGGDWEHALRVVKWVKDLGEGRDDLDMLVTVAYIHDIGWSGVAPKGKLDFEQIINLEDKASENTPIFVREVLEKLKYNNKQIQKVIRLIGAADNHESQRDDEAIIVDADSLSKLCIEHLQDKLKPSSFQKAVSLWEEEFITRIKTEKAKKIYPKLLEELKKNLKSAM